jgi:hypothetical protein
MKRNLVKVLLAVIAIAALVAVLPLAQAGTKRNHPVNATLRSQEVATQGNATIDAGLVKERRLGEGAVLIRTRSAGGNELAIRFKLFYPSGMQRGEGTLTFTVNPDGSASFTGNAHYEGGTGRFRGITGQLRVRDGTVATDGLVTATVTGNARY